MKRSLSEIKSRIAQRASKRRATYGSSSTKAWGGYDRARAARLTAELDALELGELKNQIRTARVERTVSHDSSGWHTNAPVEGWAAYWERQRRGMRRGRR